MIMALLKESKKLSAQLNTVYNEMHNGVIVIDKNSRIRLINKSGAKILGLEPDKVNGSLFGNIFPDLDLTPVLRDSRFIIGVKEN